MRTIKPIGGAVLALYVILSGCASERQPSSLQGSSQPSPPPIRTAASTSTIVGPSLPVTPTPEFSRLSPASIMRIMKYGLTIQATLFTRESCLKLDVRATGYVTMPGFPQVHLISHATFLNASTGAPLVVEQVNYGAGGGGGDGGEFLMEEQLDYDVKSSLAVTRVTAMVTFNEALGITEPVRFDLEPTSRPIMYCPQLPPTTPEG